VEFRILGPLAVVDDDRELDLGAPKQRALLALLVLHRNEPVASDVLVDLLWAGQPPSAARKSLQIYVSGLRRVLGRARVETRGRSYLLHINDGELDLDRFQALVESARATEPRRRADALRQALALFRGEPLADVRYEEFAKADIARLEELRLQTIEERTEAELACGREGTVLPELEALVASHPLRERLRGELMLALYRCGRHAEALEVYQQARRTLIDKLGLEPSPALQQLQRQILAHDPSLAAPARPPRGGTARRRRAALLITSGGTVLLAAGIAAAAAELTGTAGAHSLSRVALNSVGVIDAKTNQIVAQVPVGQAPAGIALADDSLWVVNSGDNTVSRIDAKKRTVLNTIPLPGPPSGVAADQKGAWVSYLSSLTPGQTTSGTAGAAFIDRRFNDVTRRVTPNQGVGGAGAITLGAGSVWVEAPGFVIRLDPSTGKTRATIQIGSSQHDGIVVGEGAVWAIDGLGVSRIDPTDNTVLSIPVAQNPVGGGLSPIAVTVGDGAVWVISRTLPSHELNSSILGGTVTRINPDTNSITTTIKVGHDPSAIATSDGAVWVTNTTDHTISRIDAHTNKVTTTIPIGNPPQGITLSKGTVWVSVG